MNIKERVVTALIVGSSVLITSAPSADGVSDRRLAISLADSTTESATVTSIAALGGKKIPLLLSWTRKPPHYVPECLLFDGLADAFGVMKVEEAIPYLVKNIRSYRFCGVSLAPWLKAPSVIESQLPAVGALVRIGPEASKALIASYIHITEEEDRRAALFVISQVKEYPEARAFLESVVDRTNRERDWAEEGIKYLDAPASPYK